MYDDSPSVNDGRPKSQSRQLVSEFINHTLFREANKARAVEDIGSECVCVCVLVCIRERVNEVRVDCCTLYKSVVVMECVC